MATKKEVAAAKKRSEASKKAAATRKANEAKVAEQATPPTADPDPEHDVPNPHQPEQEISDPGEDQITIEPADNQEPEPDSEYEPYSPKHRTLENAGLDQHAAEQDRQEQLAEEREVHNERTGNA